MVKYIVQYTEHQNTVGTGQQGTVDSIVYCIVYRAAGYCGQYSIIGQQGTVGSVVYCKLYRAAESNVQHLVLHSIQGSRVSCIVYRAAGYRGQYNILNSIQSSKQGTVGGILYDIVCKQHGTVVSIVYSIVYRAVGYTGQYSVFYSIRAAGNSGLCSIL